MKGSDCRMTSQKQHPTAEGNFTKLILDHLGTILDEITKYRDDIVDTDKKLPEIYIPLRNSQDAMLFGAYASFKDMVNICKFYVEAKLKQKKYQAQFKALKKTESEKEKLENNPLKDFYKKEMAYYGQVAQYHCEAIKVFQIRLFQPELLYKKPHKMVLNNVLAKWPDLFKES